MKHPMLKKAALLFGFASLVFFQSCDWASTQATGDLITQDFTESNFHGLDICVPADVEVRVGPDFKIEVTCEESVMPFVDTHVSGGILKIEFDRHVYDVDDMKIIVTAPSWDAFDISGSGRIDVVDSIAGHLLQVDISGSGTVTVDEAIFDRAQLEVSGSGFLRLNGSADELEAHISGSGDINCLDFLVKTADLHVSGSGNMKVNVSETLDAHISGSGDIEYKGAPQINVDISGSGKLRKI